MTQEILEKALPWLSVIENMRKQKSYKPVLLLSIIKEIENKNIVDSKIVLSDGIIDSFNSFYDNIGNQQGINKSFLPFYYLKTDVWNIKWRDSSNILIPSSNTSVGKNIEYVEFNNNLFDLLMDKDIRNLLKQRLINKTREDIFSLDTQKNQDFIIPENIDFYINRSFGKPSLPKTIFEDHKTTDLLFSQEKILQSFLVDHWDEISLFNDQNINIFGGEKVGVEYDTKDAGRIDILAESPINNSMTVIELKKGVGEPKHIGQILCYMGWIRSQFFNKSTVNGMLIASNFKPSIQYALQNHFISLYSYKLLFNLDKVDFN